MKKYVFGGLTALVVLVCTVFIAVKIMTSIGLLQVNDDFFAKEKEPESEIATVQPVTDSASNESLSDGNIAQVPEETPEQVPVSGDQVSENQVSGNEVSGNEAAIGMPPEDLELPQPEAEPVKEGEPVTVDLVMFMGQSNMAGCGGDASQAPKVNEGVGYEFRAISNPTQVYPVTEPFGLYENAVGGIADAPDGKKGSLVSAFVNTYYQETRVPVVAVSASQGNTSTNFWTSPAIMNDFVERYKRAVVWLENNDYKVRYKYILWLQGETDGYNKMSAEDYEMKMNDFIRPLFIEGVQKCFMVRVGRHREDAHMYDEIIKAQTEMCRKSDYYGLASTMLSKFDTSYMVDSWHYNQTALNQTGTDAAKTVAYYTINRHDASVYDYLTGEMFTPDGQEGSHE